MVDITAIVSFISNTVVFLCVLSILIIVHEFGHFIVAKKMGIRVEKFSLGFGRELLKKKSKDTQYCISAIPLGGYVKLSGDNLEEYKGRSYEYFSKSPGKRFKIIFSGPLLNYILGFLIFWLIFFMGFPAFTTKVGSVIEGFGAKDAGLQAGDKILAIDGNKITLWEQLQDIIYKKRISDKVNLSVLRGNKEFTVNVAIKAKELEGEGGRKHTIGLIGITPYAEIAKGNLMRSFILGLDTTRGLTLMIFKGLWQLITGKVSVRDSVAGPLGIFDITTKAASIGLIAILHLVAILSLSLAIFNLLPLPILDGGHIVLLGLEKIRGKTLTPKVDNIITQIGLVVIVSFALFVTYNDILRMFGDKIPKLLK